MTTKFRYFVDEFLEQPSFVGFNTNATTLVLITYTPSIKRITTNVALPAISLPANSVAIITREVLRWVRALLSIKAGLGIIDETKIESKRMPDPSQWRFEFSINGASVRELVYNRATGLITSGTSAPFNMSLHDFVILVIALNSWLTTLAQSGFASPEHLDLP